MAQAVQPLQPAGGRATGRSAAFQIDVRYSADQIATNDLLTITAQVRYTPPEPIAAGMVVLDIAVPTGFAPVDASLDALAKRTAKDQALGRRRPQGDLLPRRHAARRGR